MNRTDIIASTEFQNRFGMHTKPFQELAANTLLMAREYTDLSVREVGAYVKNLLDEKHKLELDLAEAHSQFSQSAVQAALIAGQAEEIKKLKQEVQQLTRNLGCECTVNKELKADLEQAKAERNKLSNEYHEIHKLKAELERLQKAHGAECAILKSDRERLSQERDTLAAYLNRDQTTLRKLGFVLRGTTWVWPDNPK